MSSIVINYQNSVQKEFNTLNNRLSEIKDDATEELSKTIEETQNIAKNAEKYVGTEKYQTECGLDVGGAYGKCKGCSNDHWETRNKYAPDEDARSKARLQLQELQTQLTKLETKLEEREDIKSLRKKIEENKTLQNCINSLGNDYQKTVKTLTTVKAEVNQLPKPESIHTQSNYLEHYNALNEICDNMNRAILALTTKNPDAQIDFTSALVEQKELNTAIARLTPSYPVEQLEIEMY